MSLYNQIKNKEDKISIIGLGYVGMPIAVSFSKKKEAVIGGESGFLVKTKS